MSPIVGAKSADFQWDIEDRGRSTLMGSALFNPGRDNATFVTAFRLQSRPWTFDDGIRSRLPDQSWSAVVSNQARWRTSSW